MERNNIIATTKNLFLFFRKFFFFLRELLQKGPFIQLSPLLHLIFIFNISNPSFRNNRIEGEKRGKQINNEKEIHYLLYQAEYWRNKNCDREKQKKAVFILPKLLHGLSNEKIRFINVPIKIFSFQFFKTNITNTEGKEKCDILFLVRIISNKMSCFL